MYTNGPLLWNKLLEEADLGDKALVMGGAIIDYAGNIPPKDYDIFHTYSFGEPELPPNWVKTDVDFNDPDWVAEHQELYLQGVGGEGEPLPIGSVYEYIVDEFYKVQLIGVHYENPRQHFRNFDHTLTLAWFSQKGLFVHKKAFDSFRDQVVTYVGKDKSVEAKARSLVRAKAKTARYGGVWVYMGFDEEED